MDQHLSAYLARIGLTEAPPATPAGLALLQAAHRRTIPFENLDILLGRRIAIGPDHVFGKLVTNRRGGYCFEQNRLLSDMLAALGMANRALLARVRLGLTDEQHAARTHVLLLVDLDGEAWIADAGFGGSYVPPLPLRDGASAETGDGARHRLRKIGTAGTLAGEWLLERAGPPEATDGRRAQHGDWLAQYSFDLAEVAQEDLEQANHWTATWPQSRFTKLQVVSIALPDGFASMIDGQLNVYSNGSAKRREVCDVAEYRAVLADLFGLDLSEKDLASLPLAPA